MAEQAQHTVTDVMTMYKAAFFELPVAGAKWGSGIGKEQEVAEAVWKGYDAWVRLTTTSIDELYKNSLFGEIVARSLDGGVRWDSARRWRAPFSLACGQQWVCPLLLRCKHSMRRSSSSLPALQLRMCKSGPSTR